MYWSVHPTDWLSSELWWIILVKFNLIYDICNAVHTLAQCIDIMFQKLGSTLLLPFFRTPNRKEKRLLQTHIFDFLKKNEALLKVVQYVCDTSEFQYYFLRLCVPVVQYSITKKHEVEKFKRKYQKQPKQQRWRRQWQRTH